MSVAQSNQSGFEPTFEPTGFHPVCGSVRFIIFNNCIQISDHDVKFSHFVAVHRLGKVKSGSVDF